MFKIFSNHTGREGLCLRIAIVATLVFILPAPVLAQDIAQRRILGFSPQGDYFAFEEFGKQANTGFAYATIYVVDTNNNRWIKGSPFRVVIRDRRSSRIKARRRVERKARFLLRKLGIQRDRLRILASNPLTELSSNKKRVKVNPRLSIYPTEQPLIFSIREIDMSAPHCGSYGERAVKGLIIRVRRQGEPLQILHRDRYISLMEKIRGC